MDCRMGCLFGCVLIVAALFQGSAAQTTHVVGGSSVGWTIPSTGFSYVSWASSQKFSVGDILEFNFPTGVHDVAKVSKTDYDSCNTNNPIGSLITTGPANVTINSTGAHYYICTFGQHCANGQKLAINIASSSPAPAPAPTRSSSPAPAPTGSSSGAPAPTPTSAPTPTGSTSSAPTPTPTSAPTPTGSGPPAPTSAPTPTGSGPPAPTSAPTPTGSPSGTANSSPTPTGSPSGTPTPTSSEIPTSTTPPAPSSASSLTVGGFSFLLLSTAMAFFY